MAERLRSLNSHKRVSVRFANASSDTVGLYWVDYAGEERLSKVLPAVHCVNVDTYETHPWLFRETVTGERYVARNRQVYFPSLQSKPVREVVNITAPLLTLRRAALLHLARSLRLDQVEGLEIPRVLLDELRSLAALYSAPRAPYEEPLLTVLAASD